MTTAVDTVVPEEVAGLIAQLRQAQARVNTAEAPLERLGRRLRRLREEPPMTPEQEQAKRVRDQARANYDSCRDAQTRAELARDRAKERLTEAVRALAEPSDDPAEAWQRVLAAKQDLDQQQDLVDSRERQRLEAMAAKDQAWDEFDRLPNPDHPDWEEIESISQEIGHIRRQADQASTEAKEAREAILEIVLS